MLIVFAHFPSFRIAPSSLIILPSLSLFSISLFHHLFLPVAVPPQLLNLSLFNQHPLNINIAAHVLSNSAAPSFFFHHLFMTVLTTFTSRGITFPINHLLSHLLPSVLSLRHPISPRSPYRATSHVHGSP